ncbi:uncharacterized protein LOC126901527 [Daktulosphaira vitifoliae]|uniref:uncharacterized protein LOC126901527 n=1 Tax=Daktulosphaira vitifoliae TaxID=58002 RepID=UPI0021AAF6DA|nr:uncharacterized protein LOC126901527 [Daktulosphaira vitifoliae]
MKTIINNQGWDSFKKTKIIEEDRIISFNDCLGTNEPIYPHIICSIISCQYTHLLLTYAALIENLANEFKTLKKRVEINKALEKLYNIITNIQDRTKFIEIGINYGRLLEDNYFQESFLCTPLKNLYENINKITTQPIYVIILLNNKNFVEKIDTFIEPLNIFKKEIYDNIIGKFCVEQQDSPVPDLEFLKKKYENNKNTETFEAFLLNMIVKYPYECEVKYFSKIGLSLRRNRVLKKTNWSENNYVTTIL